MQSVYALALAFVISLSAFGQANAWTREQNYDRPGSDLRNFEIVPRVNSIAGDGVNDRCEAACQADPKCKAWTAVRAGIQSKNAKCWLKSEVPPLVANNCCTSGSNKRLISHKGKGPTSGTPPPVSTFGNKVLEFSRSKVGQRLGDGECTRLVEGALAYAGAPPGKFPSNGDYSWGRQINFPTEAALPGDIIQLVNTRFTNGGFSSWTDTQHSAVIESANGKVLQVLEQNAPTGSAVKRSQYDLNWKLERGFYKIYRPV